MSCVVCLTRQHNFLIACEMWRSELIYRLLSAICRICSSTSCAEHVSVLNLQMKVFRFANSAQYDICKEQNTSFYRALTPEIRNGYNKNKNFFNHCALRHPTRHSCDRRDERKKLKKELAGCNCRAKH